MARRWRRTITDAANWHQDQALNATIYILRQTGPTGFLLKEEGEEKKFKVYLGDPHTCSCSVFRKEKDICKHISWILLKKFRIDRTNPLTWQLGLVERELNEIVNGGEHVRQKRVSAAARRMAKIASRKDSSDDENKQEGNGIEQKEISEEDVCPICQENLLDKRLPVTYCKNGCGNNVHIKCMKVWADHQRTTGQSEITCPFCRENFGPFHELATQMYNSRSERPSTDVNGLPQHRGISCNFCHQVPIIGKCYRCGSCAEFHLCQTCFNSEAHRHHSFLYRQRPNHRWKPAQRGAISALPQAIIDDIGRRELRDEDYELLLQLDSEQSMGSDLDESIVQSLSQQRLGSHSALLQPGRQCRACLKPYNTGEFVRHLPCSHIFHRSCIDNWLLHRKASCPQCGATFTNQGLRQYLTEKRRSNSIEVASIPKTEEKFELCVPSVGLQRNKSADNRVSRPVHPKRPHRLPPFVPPTFPQGSTLDSPLEVNGQRQAPSSAILLANSLFKNTRKIVNTGLKTRQREADTYWGAVREINGDEMFLSGNAI